MEKSNKEDKLIQIRAVLKYVGINNPNIMKPQQDIIEKWLFDYNFSVDIILKACKICLERISRADFKYIDGILTKWFKSGYKTLRDVESNDLANKPKGKTQYAEQNVTRIMDKEIKDKFVQYCGKNGLNAIDVLEHFMIEYTRGSEITYKNKF